MAGHRFWGDAAPYRNALRTDIQANQPRQIADEQQISSERFQDFDVLHYEVENRLLRLLEKLEQKRDDADWIARIAEDSEEYVITPPPHRSTTPLLRPNA